MSIGGFPSFVEDMKVRKTVHVLFSLSWKKRKEKENDDDGDEYLNLNSGFPKRKAEWTLWRECICDKQHIISNAISDTDHLHFWDGVLLHGAVTPRNVTLHILRVVPLRECDRGREPHDGYR